MSAIINDATWFIIGAVIALVLHLVIDPAGRWSK